MPCGLAFVNADAGLAIDWQQYMKRLDASAAQAPFYSLCKNPEPVPVHAPAATLTSQVQPAAALGHSMPQTSPLARVREAVSGVLGSSIGDNDPLMAGGLDSLGSIELRNLLEQQTSTELPSTLVFDHPTIASISQLITSLLPIDSSHQPMEVLDISAEVSSTDVANPFVDGGLQSAAGLQHQQVVGIMSMAIQSPGDALDKLLQHDCSAVIPASRWDVEAAHSGGNPVRFGIILQDVERFDAAAFGISGHEATLMDPQQRLLLETTSQALATNHMNSAPGEHAAGAQSQSFAGFGVWMGVSAMDYATLAARFSPEPTAFSATGRALSCVSGRLAYTFGMHGPAMTIETACSSSLVAAHVAASHVALQGYVSPLSHVTGSAP